MIFILRVIWKMGFELFHHIGIENAVVDGQNVVPSVPLTELLSCPIQNY